MKLSIPVQLHNQTGVLSMFGAATIWGTWVLILSFIELPSIYIVAITFVVATIALMLFVLMSHKFGALMTIFQNRDFRRLLMLVGSLEVIQTSLYIVSFSIAIQDGGAVVIPIIRSTVGILTPMLATFSSNERFAKMYLFYGTLSSIGAILIFSYGGVTAGEDISYLALVMVIVSVLVRGWFYLQQRHVAQKMMEYHYDARLALTAQLIISSILLIMISIVYFLVTPTPQVTNLGMEIAFLLVIGVTHTGLASLLRLLAMKKITAQQSVIIMYVDPVLSVSLSILFLGETVTASFFIGAALIIFSAMASSLYRTGDK